MERYILTPLSILLLIFSVFSVEVLLSIADGCFVFRFEIPFSLVLDVGFERSANPVYVSG